MTGQTGARAAHRERPGRWAPSRWLRYVVSLAFVSLSLVLVTQAPSFAAPGITLTKTATLTPFIAGNLTLDKLRHLEPDEIYGSTVYGGVTLSVRF